MLVKYKDWKHKLNHENHISVLSNKELFKLYGLNIKIVENEDDGFGVGGIQEFKFIDDNTMIKIHEGEIWEPEEEYNERLHFFKLHFLKKTNELIKYTFGYIHPIVANNTYSMWQKINTKDKI